MLNRRNFTKLFGIVIGMPSLIISSCKQAVTSTNYALTKPQKTTLEAVHDHLFPSEPNRPGALEVNSVLWVSKILCDPQVKDHKKRLQLQGVNWVRETSHDLFDTSFHLLAFDHKEEVLRDLARYSNGENWISQNLSFILEALLADPVYEVNNEQKGWIWLKHKTGYPRPTENTKYPYL